MSRAPQQPWRPGQQIEASRLEAMRSTMIADVSVAGMKMIRNRNSVAFLRDKEDKLVPTVLVKTTTVTSAGQPTRLNARKEVRQTKSNATGALAEADVATFPSTDNVTVWELDAIQNLRVGIGLGGDTTGKQIIGLIPRGYFPVKITKDGGADGTLTTVATWTYTVKDLAGNTLKTNVALSHPRPKGKAVFGTTYGTAFFDGSTLILWNAGEVYTTGVC